MAHLGDKVRAIFKTRNILQQDIAPKIGLSKEQLSRNIKTGKFKLENMLLLSKELKVSMAYWFDEGYVESNVLEEISVPYGDNVKKKKYKVNDYIKGFHENQKRIAELEHQLNVIRYMMSQMCVVSSQKYTREYCEQEYQKAMNAAPKSAPNE